MRSVVLGLGICVVAASTLSAQDATMTKGQQVYADQKCGFCHSIGDKGNKKGPLDGVGSKLSAADLRLWMTDAKAMTEKTKSTRKPEMKQYTLPKEDVDSLVAFLQAQKGK